MFGLDWFELMVIGAVALVVIGPKELPDALHILGRWMSKARSYAREFQNQFDELIREAEVKRMREEWNNNVLEKERLGLEAELAAIAKPPETSRVKAAGAPEIEQPPSPPTQSPPEIKP
jgi:sec-independent protein translocase protein TatB